MSNVKIIEPGGVRQQTLGELKCENGAYAVTEEDYGVIVWQKRSDGWTSVGGALLAGIIADTSLSRPARLLPSGTIIQIEVP